MNLTMNLEGVSSHSAACRIGDLAVAALLAELHTFPKPGLVSLVDAGSHTDMDAGTFRVSAEALQPFFRVLSEAGTADAEMDNLRAAGRAAEQAMLVATGGVNTHRGAIFGLGLLCAAAGALGGRDNRIIPFGALGAFVRRRWGRDILCGPLSRQSHGALALRRYGAGGARAEAAAGFPSVYQIGLPAWREGLRLTQGDENAACVQACFALMAEVTDTNLLHRSGNDGLHFARQSARRFLERGGVGMPGWKDSAVEIHRDFVALRLSPGGSADLLAATWLVNVLEAPALPGTIVQRYHF